MITAIKNKIIDSPDEIRRVIITPPKGWIPLDLGELWASRELFFFMVWRDIKVKYKQTLLGFLWAVLVPFLNMVVLTVLFDRVTKLEMNGLKGPVYFYSAMVPWTYFANSLTLSSNSMVQGANMMTKVYFPRMILPLSACLSGIVDFLIAFAILFPIMLSQGYPPAASTWVLIPLSGLTTLTAAGCGFFLSALNVKYRDIRYVIPFLVQLWMWCSVLIPFSKVAEKLGPWKYLWGLNPMAGVIEGFRYFLLHPHMTIKIDETTTVPVPMEPVVLLIAIGAAVSTVLFWSGAVYFKRTEKQFADIV